MTCCCACRKPQFALRKPSPFHYIRLILPGQRFPRHAAGGGHVYHETFSKIRDASVVAIPVSHPSLSKYTAPTHLLALYSNHYLQIS